MKELKPATLRLEELQQNDLVRSIARIPTPLTRLLKTNDLFLGGGFIRSIVTGEKISDYDVFGSSKNQLESMAALLVTEQKGTLHKSKNSLTVRFGLTPPVQFITRWMYDDPQTLLDGFDFTVCQAVLWFDKPTQRWRSLTSPSFYPDLAAKRLVYTHPRRDEAPGGSFLRVRKFLQRGYNIQVLSLAGVLARIFLAVRNKTGVEPETVIAGILREVDPLVVCDDLTPEDLQELQDFDRISEGIPSESNVVELDEDFED